MARALTTRTVPIAPHSPLKFLRGQLLSLVYLPPHPLPQADWAEQTLNASIAGYPTPRTAGIIALGPLFRTGPRRLDVLGSACELTALSFRGRSNLC